MQTPTTQAEAVIYYLQQLDLEMLELILEEDRTYQDLPKAVFLENLNYVFKRFNFYGHTVMSVERGFCSSHECPNQCKNGISLIDHKSRQYINLIIEVKDGKVLDIYDCKQFSLFNKETDLEWYSRLYIDYSSVKWENGDDDFDLF